MFYNIWGRSSGTGKADCGCGGPTTLRNMTNPVEASLFSFQSGSDLDGLISRVREIVGALLWRERVEEGPDGVPESISGPSRSLPEERFELGKDLLDGVQVRAVGGKIQQTGLG